MKWIFFELSHGIYLQNIQTNRWQVLEKVSSADCRCDTLTFSEKTIALYNCFDSAGISVLISYFAVQNKRLFYI